MEFRAFMLKTSHVILTGTERVKVSSLSGCDAGITCKRRHYCPSKHWGLSATWKGITAPKTLNLQQQHCGKFYHLFRPQRRMGELTYICTNSSSPHEM